MVTRRPTLVQLKKANESTKEATLTLQLGRLKGSITEETFDTIINTIKEESIQTDRVAYMGELIIEITAPGLPNINFTDLPGLVTETKNAKLVDVVSGEEEEIGIRELVESYMIRDNTTLVVVEPATCEDFASSQVSPILRYK